jgi:predicted nucleic acid-binding protein
LFNKRKDEIDEQDQPQPLWLSAVVLEELYVGALNAKLKKFLEKFEKNFENINRLLVPNKTDWTTCGQVLAMIGSKYGFDLVKRARMTNDCLIAMSSRRNGFKVFTHNADDFEIISEFRPFDWKEIIE